MKTLLALLLLIPNLGWSSETINVTCEYLGIFNVKDRSYEKTSGTDTVKIVISNDVIAMFSDETMCVPIGSISTNDNEFLGECTKEGFDNYLTINRVTGEYERALFYEKDDGGGLIINGVCKLSKYKF